MGNTIDGNDPRAATAGAEELDRALDGVAQEDPPEDADDADGDGTRPPDTATAEEPTTYGRNWMDLGAYYRYQRLTQPGHDFTMTGHGGAVMWQGHFALGDGYKQGTTDLNWAENNLFFSPYVGLLYLNAVGPVMPDQLGTQPGFSLTGGEVGAQATIHLVGGLSLSAGGGAILSAAAPKNDGGSSEGCTTFINGECVGVDWEPGDPLPEGVYYGNEDGTGSNLHEPTSAFAPRVQAGLGWQISRNFGFDASVGHQWTRLGSDDADAEGLTGHANGLVVSAGIHGSWGAGENNGKGARRNFADAIRSLAGRSAPQPPAPPQPPVPPPPQAPQRRPAPEATHLDDVIAANKKLFEHEGGNLANPTFLQRLAADGDLPAGQTIVPQIAWVPTRNAEGEITLITDPTAAGAVPAGARAVPAELNGDGTVKNYYLTTPQMVLVLKPASQAPTEADLQQFAQVYQAASDTGNANTQGVITDDTIRAMRTMPAGKKFFYDPADPHSGVILVDRYWEPDSQINPRNNDDNVQNDAYATVDDLTAFWNAHAATAQARRVEATASATASATGRLTAGTSSAFNSKKPDATQAALGGIPNVSTGTPEAVVNTAIQTMAGPAFRDYNQANKTSANLTTILEAAKAIAEAYNQIPAADRSRYHIVVAGFTDNDSDPSNPANATNRAELVRQILIRYGIPASQIQAEAHPGQKSVDGTDGAVTFQGLRAGSDATARKVEIFFKGPDRVVRRSIKYEVQATESDSASATSPGMIQTVTGLTDWQTVFATETISRIPHSSDANKFYYPVSRHAEATATDRLANIYQSKGDEWDDFDHNDLRRGVTGLTDEVLTRRLTALVRTVESGQELGLNPAVVTALKRGQISTGMFQPLPTTALHTITGQAPQNATKQQAALSALSSTGLDPSNWDFADPYVTNLGFELYSLFESTAEGSDEEAYSRYLLGALIVGYGTASE